MQEDHGSVGCSTDVLSHLDRKCTGRHTCYLPIPDATLHSMQTCPRELIPYLEASYECLPGESPLVTDRVSRKGKATSSVRPSVCPSVCFHVIFKPTDDL